MDTIHLHGLRVLTIIGALPEEQLAPQPCEIDAVLHVDLREAGATDDLTATVNYAEVLDAFARVVGDRHVLLEHLAQRLCDAALAFPAVAAVDVDVRKLRPPVPYDLASTGVRLHRCR